MTEALEAIHRFWFGANAGNLGDAAIAERQRKLWWSKHAETDAAIRLRFGDLIEPACRGELEWWAATPRGLLALILLTDQFPRSARRNTAGAFSADQTARQYCRRSLAEGFDRLLRPIERVFVYLPLEHSESLSDQEQAVALFQALADAVPAEDAAAFEGFLDFARRHRDVIARFGRFPHRNSILGRQSTPEEAAFLNKPGSRF